jgi:RNA polymerase sigma-70 factor (ECF subfamily)
MCAQARGRFLTAPDTDPWVAGAPQSEPDRVGRAASGDDAAFEELVRHYHAPVWRLVGRVLRGDVEAVVEQVFLAARAALREAPLALPFAVCLRRLAVERALDASVAPRPSRTAPAAERPILEACFDEVDPALRAAIALQLEGLDHQEIADDLGLSVATVRHRIASARETLTRRLEKKAKART